MLYIVENKYYSYSNPIICVNESLQLSKSAIFVPTFKCFMSSMDDYNIITLDTNRLFIYIMEFKDRVVYFESLEDTKILSEITSNSITTLQELTYDPKDIYLFAHDHFITNLNNFSQIKYSYKLINIFKSTPYVRLTEYSHNTSVKSLFYIISTNKQKFCITIHEDKDVLHFYIDENSTNYYPTSYEKYRQQKPIVFRHESIEYKVPNINFE